jgi:hypothetical protein
MTEALPDGYPPLGAAPMEGEFFRLARPDLAVGEAPGPDSWLRPHETRGSELFRQVDNIEAHGLSVRNSLPDLQRDRDITPWMAKKSVAAFTISVDDGWLKETPEHGIGHHDWWTKPPGLVPAAVVVEEGRAAS